jgi:hypothetical protein
MTTTPDFRALLADDAYAASFQSVRQYRTALLKALATPPPTDDELIEIARQLREIAGYLQLGCGWDRAIKAIESASILIEGDLFQRLAPPPPPPTCQITFNASPLEEVIRLDKEGFHYKGQFIADAGEAHRLLMAFLEQNTKDEDDRWPHL